MADGYASILPGKCCRMSSYILKCILRNFVFHSGRAHRLRWRNFPQKLTQKNKNMQKKSANLRSGKVQIW